MRLLTGIRPTGQLHIGNYFGAVKNFLDLQKEYESLLFVADYHGFISQQDPKNLQQGILEIAADYLSLELEPSTIIFKQSDVPEVTELTWIFNCLITVPYLERAHAYKDALNKGAKPTVGLFDYPTLMSSDILIYEADVVPVGKDQKQHLEIARDIAQKFNQKFGETFHLPKPVIIQNTEMVTGLDGRKMSKSYHNTIKLFEEKDDLIKKIRSIVTDSKRVDEPKDPDQCPVFALHRLFSQDILPELKERYLAGNIGYKESKDILIENIEKFIAPLREKRKEIIAQPEKIKEKLREGAEKVRPITQKKIKEVREKIGVE
ncbi:MAG TPA: tryptophan--tRNA ligase [Candidatus Portnoybacteria bacterium]|nr:tryptophan--tRNA ligase [Candidatus Portnoybacteria bacterium]